MKLVRQFMTRTEAIVLFAAYAQECAREHQVPLVFNNWLRNRRITLESVGERIVRRGQERRP